MKINLPEQPEIRVLGKRGFQIVRTVYQDNPQNWGLRDEHGQTIIKFYGTASEVSANLRAISEAITILDTGGVSYAE